MKFLKYPKLLTTALLLISGGIYRWFPKPEVMPGSPCQDFTLVSGNPNIATRIFLAESNHYKDRAKVAACIDTLNADLVLVEGVEINQEVECKSQKINNAKNRQCVGFSAKETVDYIYQEASLDLYGSHLSLLHSDKQNGLSDDAMDQYVKNDLKTVQEKIAKFDKKFKPANYLKKIPVLFTEEENNYIALLVEQEVYADVLAMRFQSLSYETIFSKNKDKITRQYGEAKEIMKNPRKHLMRENKSLMKSLAGKQGFFKQAIVGGKAHFVKPSKPLKNRQEHTEAISEAVDYLLAELAKIEDQNPYAILAVTNSF